MTEGGPPGPSDPLAAGPAPRCRKRSWAQVWVYDALRVLAQWLVIACFDFRVMGREHLPAQGCGLLLSSHQSVMDPALVGLICNRRLNYLARRTLFRNRIFAWLIRFLDAIEIDREGGGLLGIRETIARLRRGELVLLFPEGTRTRDGDLLPLKAGFVMIARRAETPLIPIAIVGAFDCFPKGTRLPSRRPIAVVVGLPLTSGELAMMKDDQIVETIRQRIAQCHHRARQVVG
jgi:1-acyl-sn-glycerol-3-phosphate acyltransferase